MFCSDLVKLPRPPPLPHISDSGSPPTYRKGVLSLSERSTMLTSWRMQCFLLRERSAMLMAMTALEDASSIPSQSIYAARANLDSLLPSLLILTTQNAPLLTRVDYHSHKDLQNQLRLKKLKACVDARIPSISSEDAKIVCWQTHPRKLNRAQVQSMSHNASRE